MLNIKETSEVGLRSRPSFCYYEFELLSERTLQFSGKNQYPISDSIYSMFLSPYYNTHLEAGFSQVVFIKNNWLIVLSSLAEHRDWLCILMCSFLVFLN